MAAELRERSVLALAALQLFPPSIRQSLCLDPVFRGSYGLTVDAQISFGDSGVSMQRSKLFNGVRELLADRTARPTLKDTTGNEWGLELIENDNELQVALSDGKRRLVLPDFATISPNQAERVEGFERKANNVHLPEQTVSGWRSILASRALTNDEIDVLHTEIEETPIRVAGAILAELEKGKSSLSTFVPRSERYFNRLVGEHRQSGDIVEYAHAGAREHVRQLISWRPYDGFILSLLLSSHSSIATLIEVDQLDERDHIRAYEWLHKDGDRISQIGGIEVGLSILDKQPKIEPYVQGIIEQIRDDRADDERSQFHILSSLIVLVDGELSRTKVLRGVPPFWRRLASIAQASLVERSIIKFHLDIAEFTNWAMQSRLQRFYLQTMADLRREPRWRPDYVSSHHLKAEFIARILNAAHQNATKIHTPAMRELLFGNGPGSLQPLMTFPFQFLPGPLEGSIESQIETPVDVLREIEERLNADVLQPNSFAALVNSALVFRLDSHQAQLAARALRRVKHQLRHADNEEHLTSVLNGLATVAAVTRSRDLAQELKILIRRCRYEAGRSLSAEQAMWIGLCAAAAHSQLTDWCEFVGEWITEIAFQSLQIDEMKRLHSHVVQLCHIVPELWRTCGRAEAALNT